MAARCLFTPLGTAGRVLRQRVVPHPNPALHRLLQRQISRCHCSPRIIIQKCGTVLQRCLYQRRHRCSVRRKPGRGRAAAATLNFPCEIRGRVRRCVGRCAGKQRSCAREWPPLPDVVPSDSKAAASQLLRDGQLRALRCTVCRGTKINAQCSSNYPFIDKKGQRPSELQTAGDMSGNVPTRKFLAACFGSRGSLQDSAQLPEAGKEDTVTARLHQSRPHLSAGAS